MSDLFHSDVEDSYICKIFRVMNSTPQHKYQVLTKRIERLKYLHSSLEWSNNIWLGVSVESNDFTKRVELLKETSALTKFISFEPLISNIDYQDYSGIDWVLVGGESGGKARPIEKDWVITIKENCKVFNVPFFFKQWGKRIHNPNKSDPTLNKLHPSFSKGGCMIDNKIYREYPKR